MVIFKVLNPPPMPPYAAAFPNNVTVLLLMGSQPELFTSTLAWVPELNPWIRIQSIIWPLRFALLGIVTGTDAVVPFGPITSSGSMMVLVLELLVAAVGIVCGLATDGAN